MNEQKTDKVNEMAIMSSVQLGIAVPSDGHFSPTVFERYQRNKAPHGFNVGNVCIRRFNS